MVLIALNRSYLHPENPGSEPGSDGTPQGTKGGVCTKCGANAKGKKSCCFAGGAWFKKCGDSDKFEHTWSEGTRACASKCIMNSDASVFVLDEFAC